MKISAPSVEGISGFTLVEVLVAVGVVTIGFLGAFAMVLQCGRQASAAEESALVCSSLEQQIDLLRTLSWSSLTDGTGVTGTVWNAQPAATSGIAVSQEAITISAYNQANTQTLSATWNASSSPVVSFTPASGAQALGTATAVNVVVTVTWTGSRSHRPMTQSLVTMISQGGISKSVLP
jgi:prepilin-type N-terminal cleavage/methylation domain-containing protein